MKKETFERANAIRAEITSLNTKVNMLENDLKHMEAKVDMNVLMTDDDNDKVSSDYWDAITIEFRYNHDKSTPRLRFEFSLEPEQVKIMLQNYYQQKISQCKAKMLEFETEFQNLKD